MDEDATQVPGINGPGMTPTGCPATIKCPGIDSPVSNFSSEGADPLIFVGTGWPSFDPYRPPPLNGNLFYANDCYGNQISATSQEEADFISYTIAQLCQNHPGDSQQSYQTLEQTACGFCPDGREFCYTVPAYTFVAPVQSDSGVAMVASANEQSMAYAKQQISILASRGICDRITCKINSSSPLPDATQGTPYSYQFLSSSLSGHTSWSVTSGTLPPGLSLAISGLLSGTPTTSGNYTFQVLLLCGGVYPVRKTFKLKVKQGVQNNRYWTMDESGSADRVDKFVGDVIRAPAPQIVGSAAGKISNAMSVAGTSVGYGYAFTNSINVATTQKGFSVAFWFKLLADATAGTPAPLATIRLNLLKSDNSNGYTVGLDYLTANGFWSVAASDWNNFYNNECGAVSLPIGQWVFVHIFFDGTTKKVGYSLNGGSEVVGADILASADCDVYSLEIFSFGFSYGPQFLVDEVLIRLQGKLTPAEITAIYNGGAGVTWPAIQGIVPP